MKQLTESFMEKAVLLSKENIQSEKGGPFGAVIVKNGEIISTGVNKVTVLNDPTAHAEIEAIRAACKVLNTFILDGCEIYSSCEPCPMCLSAIYWARISKIYYANTREDAASINFDDEFLYEEIVKSPEQRKIPMIQIMLESAGKVFEEWKNKTDKIHY
ncbi:MAG TPA: nucleoside deaminase [Ignavibacteria bacterium]|nr:nucleoside deaminase [Ignavibacteria bacterium]